MNKNESSPTAKLAASALADSERWFPSSSVIHSIPHHVLGLAGEVGEFANLVKKIERGDFSMREARVRHALAMELADVYTYTLLLSTLIGIDLEKAYEVKRIENNRKFTDSRNGAH